MKNIRLFLPLLVVSLLISACGAAPEAEGLHTPQYTVTLPGDIPVFAPNEVHTSEQGVLTIAPSEKEKRMEGMDIPEETEQTGQITPETVWEFDHTVTYNAFTMPDKAALDENGCIGVLSIPAIALNINVYEAEDSMEAMQHGAAHYKDTSAWDGNIGISAHNGGVPLEVSFANLHKLKKGDTVAYSTALGERSYTVSVIREIEDDDWSCLSRTADNRITMTTCISGKPDKRLMVQAVQD